MNPIQAAIWLIYGAVMLILLGMLTYGAKVAIKTLVSRWRDPVGDISYGERQSDWDGE